MGNPPDEGSLVSPVGRVLGPRSAEFCAGSRLSRMPRSARPDERSARRRLLAERLTAQLLAGPRAPDVVGVAGQLLAVQGQDRRGVRLAIRARTSGLDVSAF